MPANGNVVDVNGTAIIVGSKVKILATVLSIEPFSNHFLEVTLQFANLGQAPIFSQSHDSGIQDGTQSILPGVMRRNIAPVITKINSQMLVVGS